MFTKREYTLLFIFIFFFYFYFLANISNANPTIIPYFNQLLDLYGYVERESNIYKLWDIVEEVLSGGPLN